MVLFCALPGRRIVVVAVAMAVLLAIAAPLPANAQTTDLSPGGTFVDDDGIPAEGYIEAIAAAGITNGCNPPGNDRFCPDRTLTRSEMATLLVRALGLSAPVFDYFTDDNGSAHESSINSLAEAGVTTGCGSDRFCGASPVTRSTSASSSPACVAVHEPPAASSSRSPFNLCVSKTSPMANRS